MLRIITFCILISLSSSFARGEESPLFIMMRTMPRDHDLYVYIDLERLFDEENTFGLSSDKLKNELDEVVRFMNQVAEDYENSTQTDVFFTYYFDKLITGNIKQILFALSFEFGKEESKVIGCDYRIYGDLSMEEMIGNFDPEIIPEIEYNQPFKLNEKELIILDGEDQPSTEVRCVIYSDQYHGFSDSVHSLRLDPDDVPNNIAQHFGNIALANPVACFTTSNEDVVLGKISSQFGRFTDDKYQTYRAFSGTLLNSSGVPTINFLMEYDSQESLDNAFTEIEHAYDDLQNEFQEIARRFSQYNIEPVPELRRDYLFTKAMLSMLYSSKLSKDAPYLKLRAPLYREFVENATAPGIDSVGIGSIVLSNFLESQKRIIAEKESFQSLD